MKKIILFIIYFFIFIKAINAEESIPVDVIADSMQWDDKNRVAYAKGNAEASQGERKLSADELIVHLNNIWEDVDEWWFSEKTQRNINLFNSNFNNKGSIISLFKLRKYVKSNIY